MLIYNSLFKSYLEYGLIAFGHVKPALLKPLKQIHKKCIRNIAMQGYRTTTDPIFEKLNVLKLDKLLLYHSYCFMYKYIHKSCPKSFDNFFTPLSGDNRSKSFKLQVPKKKKISHFPSYKIPKIWNELHLSIKRINSFKQFKIIIREMLQS